MSFRPVHNRFTVYDMMEAKGIFAENPANVESRAKDGSPLYRGPVEYPKMFYHPRGEERVSRPAEMAVTSRGDPLLNPDGTYRMIGEQRELVVEIAHDAKDERRLREEGWHDNPSDATFARTGVMPPKSPAGVIASKDAEIADLRRRLAEAQGEPIEGSPDAPSGDEDDLPSLSEAALGAA